MHVDLRKKKEDKEKSKQKRYSYTGETGYAGERGYVPIQRCAKNLFAHTLAVGERKCAVEYHMPDTRGKDSSADHRALAGTRKNSRTMQRRAGYLFADTLDVKY